MSRLIVKNLPTNLKEERLRNVFSKHGHVTECSLKYARNGVFRKFAFVGFQNESEAQDALHSLNKTFVDTSRVEIEIAKDLADTAKPRAWSKYTPESSAYKKTLTEEEINDEKAKKKELKNKKKEKKKEDAMKEMLGELKDDPEFEEFLSAHKAASTKAAWTNDEIKTKAVKKLTQTKTLPKSSKDSAGRSSENEDSGVEEGANDSKEEISSVEKKKTKDYGKKKKDTVAKQKNVSDLDYLKTKVKPASIDSGESDSDSEEEKTEHSGKDDEQSESPDKDEHGKEEFVLKMRGFKGNFGENVITEFFKPIQTVSIKIPRNATKNPNGTALVKFGNEKDFSQALRRNKIVLGGKRIYLTKVAANLMDDTKKERPPRLWELKKDEEQTETIAESGRLYLRNLSYTCKEEDIEDLLKTYGPMTEVNLPIDFRTKKPMGFAFVTFMIPEHAVKAFTELDGSSFQGRLLHILPGKEKKESVGTSNEKSSFKKDKEAKQKALAKSSHNWNTLFLGANTVADVMSEKYNTSKSDLLDVNSKQSLGVRLALGETQIVAETRDFLIENGVALDSFSQPAAERSKTVIIAKNLPASTTVHDLQTSFEKYGTLGRLLLPPSAVTALIEFSEPTEARKAFSSLAYSKFKHLPLYLEWAPLEVFKLKAPEETEGHKDKNSTSPVKMETGAKESDAETDDEAEPDSILFVKNLNFETKEEDIFELFKQCGKVRRATISKKKDMNNPGQFLSMGYGFVEYKKSECAKKAMKQLQHSQLDGHQLELKVSNRATLQPNITQKKSQTAAKQTSSKILVRNIPFEAKEHEISEMFKVFGELKNVRLPKKMSGTGSHRGFCFVDFLTRHDAKRAYNALCHSTHLYGRRLVLEWAESEENIDELRKKTAAQFHEDAPKKKIRKMDIMNVLGGD